MARGADHWAAQLNDKVVLRCRRMARKGMKYSEMVRWVRREFGLRVSIYCLNQACVGRTWKHLPGAANKRWMRFSDL